MQTQSSAISYKSKWAVDDKCSNRSPSQHLAAANPLSSILPKMKHIIRSGFPSGFLAFHVLSPWARGSQPLFDLLSLLQIQHKFTCRLLNNELKFTGKRLVCLSYLSWTPQKSSRDSNPSLSPTKSLGQAFKQTKLHDPESWSPKAYWEHRWILRQWCSNKTFEGILKWGNFKVCKVFLLFSGGNWDGDVGEDLCVKCSSRS